MPRDSRARSRRWHVNTGGAVAGPFTAAQLRGLAAADMLTRDTAVRREDRPDAAWVRAERLGNLFPPVEGRAAEPGEREFFEEVDAYGGGRDAPPDGGPGGTEAVTAVPAGPDATDPGEPATGHPLDLLLPAARELLPERTCVAVNRGIWNLGRWAQWFTLAAFAVYGLTLALKIDSVQAVVIAGLSSVGLLLLQFWAQRTGGAIRAVVAAVPVRVRSTAVVDGVVVSALCGAVALPGWLWLTLFQMNVPPKVFVPAVLGAAGGLLYLAVLALHPGLMNVRADPDVGAGEEAVGVVSLILRLALTFIPVAYAVAMTAAPFPLLAAAGDLWGGESAGIDQLVNGPLTQAWVLTVAGLPLAGYLAFLLCSLVTDLFAGQFAMVRAVTAARGAAGGEG